MAALMLGVSPAKPTNPDQAVLVDQLSFKAPVIYPDQVSADPSTSPDAT